MKHSLLKFGVVFAALSAIAFQSQAQENPFRRGTGRYEIPQGNRDRYEAYSMETKRRLGTALVKVQGKGVREQKRILFEAVRDVVLNLSKLEDMGRAKELLVPLVLSQGLEITYGIPNRTGEKIEDPGVLATTENPDLNALIMEDSAKMAIRLSDWDVKNLKEGKLSSAPYFAMARERLRLAQDWIAGEVGNRERSYKLIVQLLNHWLLVVDTPLNIGADLYGDLILKVGRELKDIERSGEPTATKLRLVRGLLLETREEIEKIAGAQTEDPTKDLFKEEPIGNSAIR